MKKIVVFGIIGLMLVCLSFTQATSARAQEQVTGLDTYTVNEVGDVSCTFVFTYPRDIYTQGATQYKSYPYMLVRALTYESEVTNVDVEFDDWDKKVTITFDIAGFARNEGGHWEIDVGSDLVYVNTVGNSVTFTSSSTGVSVLTFGAQATAIETITLNLPSNSEDISYDSSEHVITYVIPKSEPPKDFLAENRYPITGLLIVGAIICGVFGVYLIRKGRR